MIFSLPCSLRWGLAWCVQIDTSSLCIVKIKKSAYVIAADVETADVETYRHYITLTNGKRLDVGLFHDRRADVKYTDARHILDKILPITVDSVLPLQFPYLARISRTPLASSALFSSDRKS